MIVELFGGWESLETEKNCCEQVHGRYTVPVCDTDTRNNRLQGESKLVPVDYAAMHHY